MIKCISDKYLNLSKYTSNIQKINDKNENENDKIK
jgi:hypothetical protein